MLCLLRHGESLWNEEDRFTGWVDVPLTERGRQEALMQNPNSIYYGEINSSCLPPNTPAPVIWQDYAANLTYYTTLNYGPSYRDIAYVDLSVNGGESPLGIGLDAGSAIASIIGTALMTQPETAAAGAVIEVIGALLGAFQYQSNSVAEVVNEIIIDNNFPSYYVYVYFSNLTPVYTVSGQSFTLPKELVLINVTS